MSFEVPEVHAHPRHTGRRWLDMVGSAAAILISVTSLYVAVEHGKIMEKLVSANSLPYVEVVSGNAKPSGDSYRRVSYVEFRNAGVGPAHVKAVYVSFDGKTVRSTADLLKACCGGAGLRLVLNQSVEHFIPAGETAPLWLAYAEDSDSGVWEDFEAARGRLRIEACFCSVFGDCHRIATGMAGPAPTKACVRDDRRHFIP